MSPKNLPTVNHLTRPRVVTASYVATQCNLTTSYKTALHFRNGEIKAQKTVVQCHRPSKAKTGTEAMSD